MAQRILDELKMGEITVLVAMFDSSKANDHTFCKIDDMMGDRDVYMEAWLRGKTDDEVMGKIESLVEKGFILSHIIQGENVYYISQKGFTALMHCRDCRMSLSNCECKGSKPAVNKRENLQETEHEFGLYKFKVEFYVWEMNEDMAETIALCMIEDYLKDNGQLNEDYHLKVKRVLK